MANEKRYLMERIDSLTVEAIHALQLLQRDEANAAWARLPGVVEYKEREKVAAKLDKDLQKAVKKIMDRFSKGLDPNHYRITCSCVVTAKKLYHNKGYDDTNVLSDKDHLAWKEIEQGILAKYGALDNQIRRTRTETEDSLALSGAGTDLIAIFKGFQETLDKLTK